MTDADRIAMLEAQVSALQRQLIETADERLAREQREFQAKQLANAESRDRQIAQARIEGLDKDIADFEAWATLLSELKSIAEAKLSAVSATLVRQDLDRWERDQAHRERQSLEDTLTDIVQGYRDGTYSQLLDWLVARGLRPLPGSRHALSGRWGLRQTEKLLAALRKERTTLTNHVDSSSSRRAPESESAFTDIPYPPSRTELALTSQLPPSDESP